MTEETNARVILVLEDPERTHRVYARVVLVNGFYVIERADVDALGCPTWKTVLSVPSREKHRALHMSGDSLFPQRETAEYTTLRYILDAVAERDDYLVLP